MKTPTHPPTKHQPTCSRESRRHPPPHPFRALAARFGPDRVLGRASVSLAGLCPTEPASLDSEMSVELLLADGPPAAGPAAEGRGSTHWQSEAGRKGRASLKWRGKRGSASFALQAAVEAVARQVGGVGTGGSGGGGGIAGVAEEGDCVRFDLALPAVRCFGSGGGEGGSVVLDSGAGEMRVEVGGSVRRRAPIGAVLRVAGVEASDGEASRLRACAGTNARSRCRIGELAVGARVFIPAITQPTGFGSSALPSLAKTHVQGASAFARSLSSCPVSVLPSVSSNPCPKEGEESEKGAELRRLPPPLFLAPIFPSL